MQARHCNTGKRLTASWDHALEQLENHAAVAAALLGTAELLCCSVDGGGYVFMTKEVGW